MTFRRRILCWVLSVAFVSGYVTSYLVLSRNGMAKAREWDSDGYFFADPTMSSGFTAHRVLCILYTPLIVIDTWAGFPDPRESSEPMRGLSAGSASAAS